MFPLKTGNVFRGIQMRERVLARSIRLLCAGGLALAAAGAMAQVEVDGAPQRIEVTGSRIPALATDGASPVTTLGARDIRIDGLRNVEDSLNNLPQVFASQGTAISNGATGTATVDLRHMGSQRTLVLVDGKRLPAGSVLSVSADLNAIPAQLIRRVDVLTGGAGAVYGSGAVAGVVNVILKDDFTGVALEANAAGAWHRQHNAEVAALVRAKGYALADGQGLDAGKRDLSLLAGMRFADGRGNVTVFAGRRTAGALLQSARDYSSCTLGPASPGLTCSGSGTSVARIGTWTPDANGNPRPYVDADAYNAAPLNFYRRPSDTINANALAHLDLTPALRLYGELGYHHNDTVAQVAPGGIFYGQQASLAYENPLLNAAWRTALGLKKPGDVAKVFVGKRNTEGGPRDTYLMDTSLRAIAGIKGEVDGWHVDVFGQVAHVNHGDRVTGYFSAMRIARALDVVPDGSGQPACRAALTGVDPACVPYDLYHAGGITQPALDYLAAAGGSAGSTWQSVLGANLGTDLGRYGFKLPGTRDGLGVSFGVEQRIEGLAFEPDEARRSGDLSGAGGASQPVRGSYRVREGYGEVRLPLLEDAAFARRLDLSAAYRRSHYGTGRATNTSGLGLDWEATRRLRVRGSLQRAARAPNVLEMYTPATILLNGPTADPCGGTAPKATLAQCVATGLPAALYGKVPANTTSQYNGRAGGNRNLRPETADTVTLGLVLDLGGVALTLDAFRMTVRDAIQPYNAQATFSQCLATSDPVYCGLVHRDAAGSLWLTPDGWVDTGTTNIGSQSTSGIDVGAAWRARLGTAGTLALALSGTWVDSFAVENLPGNGSYDCAGLFGATCGVPIPRWRHKLRATWTTPWQADLSVTWRYLDRVKNDKLSGDRQLAAALATPRDGWLASRSYLDLNVQWRPTRALTLALGASNLLDKDPPFASSASVTSFLGNGNTYPQLYDAAGRTVYANATWQF
jgi:outer membrane receptor protein involved in Fe transport